MVDEKILEKTVIKVNKESFSRSVEELVWEKDISYIDSVTELSINNDIEFENVKKLLTPEILMKLEFEAESLSLLKTKETRLDF